jgi:hypothetical protein
VCWDGSQILDWYLEQTAARAAVGDHAA